MTIHSFSTLARRIIPAKSFTVFRNRKDILNQSFSSHSSQAKEALIGRLLEAKDHSGKSFDEIATHLGLTNVYTAQLFMNQAQLKPHLIPKLKEMVPSISSADLLMMQKPPFRSFDPLVGAHQNAIAISFWTPRLMYLIAQDYARATDISAGGSHAALWHLNKVSCQRKERWWDHQCHWPIHGPWSY